MTSKLFSTIKLGTRTLANRIVLPPMTRSRTDQPGDVPNALMATYYEQRASAGLIISEGAPISAAGRGYSMTPGIYSKEHIEGWKLTTDAVHQKGGKIFAQHWHVGRRSHTSIAGEQTVSASAVKDADKVAIRGDKVAIRGDKVAIRVSPHVTEGYGEDDPEIVELMLKVIEALAPMNLAYLHFSENISRYQEVPESFRQQVREIYPNPIMVAGKYTKESGQETLAKGYADMVAFGQPFITNPDFYYRIQNDIDLTPVDYEAHSTFYGGDEKGYTDYPMAEQIMQARSDSSLNRKTG